MDERSVKVELMNMCMISDRGNGRVLVQDKRGSWAGITFPGGHVEHGESMMAGVIREVREETGLTVSGLTPCGLVEWCHTEKHERCMIFLYKTSCFTGELVDETEEGRVFWMDIDELPTAALAPGIDSYLKLFLCDDANELFATWNGRGNSGFEVL